MSDDVVFAVVLDRKEDTTCPTGGFELIFKDTVVTSSKCVETKLLLEGQRIKRGDLQRYCQVDQRLSREDKREREKERERALKAQERGERQNQESSVDQASEAREASSPERGFKQEAKSPERKRREDKKAEEVYRSSSPRRSESQIGPPSPRHNSPKKKQGTPDRAVVSRDNNKKVKDLEKIYNVRDKKDGDSKREKGSKTK